MDPIKIYLQYPWKFPDSPYYKYLIENAPEGISYMNVKRQKGVITNKRFFWISNYLKKNIRNIVNVVFPSMPNAHKSPRGDYDLIHCAHCISKNKDKPWVADLEYPGQVLVGGMSKKRNRVYLAKRILLRENCKKVITWTEFMKEHLLERLPEIKEKVEVVYPPIPKPKVKREKHEGINLFFAARYFYIKGGLHALEVMDRLTKKYKNVRGIIVSEVPEEVKSRYSGNSSITFYPLMSQRELFDKVYSVGDIFIYPGYSDSFGFAIPEVMGCGIPVVSVEVTTRKEIISDGVNGFVVSTLLNQLDLRGISESLKGEPEQLIEEMVKRSEALIKNKKLLKRFSKSAEDEIIKGKFSVKRIEGQLKKIYEEALR